MYDTTQGLYALPLDVGRRPKWGKVLATENPLSGERRTRQVLTTERGLQLTLMDGCTLLASRSLPKALFGTNVRELVQAELPDALAVVDREIAEVIGVDLPPFATWSPVRVDYCENVTLASEAGVRNVIRRLRDVSLPHKGRPVAGDSGTSVAWTKGAIRPKAYSKFVESGEALADSVLRFEVGVKRRKTFLKLLNRDTNTSITLAEVLQTRVRDEVLGQYSDLFGRSTLSKQELTNWRFTQEFVDFFGSGATAARLMGFCIIWSNFGAPTMKDIAAGKGLPGFSRASIYRYFAEMRRFRLAMIAKGYDRPDVTGEQAWDNAPESLESDEKLRSFIAKLRDLMPDRPAA